MMTAYYLSLVALVLAALAGTVWLRRASDQAWAYHVGTRVRFRLSVDISQFAEVMKAAGEAVREFALAMGLRPCDCPELAEHVRECPEHPLNRGWRVAWRYRSRKLASRWHHWRCHRLTVAADHHWTSATCGRWRRVR